MLHTEYAGHAIYCQFNFHLCNNFQDFQALKTRIFDTILQQHVPFSMLMLQSGVVNKFPFDPLGLDSPTNAEKEIKNGRLAMVPLFTALLQTLC